MRLKVYIGWDRRDHRAWDVAADSLLAHTSIPVHIVRLTESMCRQAGVFWRSYRVDRDGQIWDERDGRPCSTEFSFTRFCVPALENYDEELALFMDADMMLRGDVAELVEIAAADQEKAVFCVHHDHRPLEQRKMDGVLQTNYLRKNWSSVMLFRPWKCQGLSKYKVNNWTGTQLHAMQWMPEELIGELPHEWNWLCGWSSPDMDPKLVHFTRGTPDMPGHESEDFSDEWREYAAQTNLRSAGCRDEIRFAPGGNQG